MLTDFFTDFVMMDKVTTPDGYGGIVSELRDGASFKAGISTNSSTEAQIAYQQGLKTVYTIVTSDLVQLIQNDVVKRVSDGTLFRITSNSRDMTTPAVAQVKYSQVTAEVID